MLRAVLDANVLVAGVLSGRGAPAEALDRWRSGEFDLIVSDSLLEELVRILRYPKIASRLEPGEADLVVAGLRELGVWVADPPSGERLVAADPGDDYLVALARVANAHVLVSGDNHLLELPDAQPPVVTPRVFVDRLAQS
ncbi:MAG: putative toxin-antitoxin system toxin component, PIN family [Gaiellaceae bacterium]